MIDWTKPIRQKNRGAAIYLEPSENGYHWVAVHYSCDWGIRAYTQEGKAINLPHNEGGYDLENVPETVTRYVPLFNYQGCETLDEVKDRMAGAKGLIGFAKVEHDGNKLISVEIVE